MNSENYGLCPPNHSMETNYELQLFLYFWNVKNIAFILSNQALQLSTSWEYLFKMYKSDQNVI